jgi:hypothetical protein
MYGTMDKWKTTKDLKLAITSTNSSPSGHLI